MTHQTPRQAIALTYDGATAPTLSAKGDDELAEAILAVAREHDVPIYENAELVSCWRAWSWAMRSPKRFTAPSRRSSLLPGI